MRNRLLTLIAASALAGTFAFAQEEVDPPGRAARLSYLSGTVSFQPGSVEDWIPATLNRPLTTGDRLWTENGARAELHIGSAAMRLNGRTNFSFINLDDRTAQIQISQGSLSVRVRKLAEDELIEIDTPQVAFTIVRPGEYRVDVNDQGDATVVTVRGGQGEAASEGRSFTVRAREQVRIAGAASDGAQPAYDRRDAPPSDGFDNWCMDRDRREDRSQSARYVSREMPGYADLDDNGVWRETPEYGPIWVPARVALDWAPYRFGRWAWIAPWGWTWVDDAPWGYAPFHYGRWVFAGGGWGWVPGPVAVRPVYSPAMVAWVGGPRFGVSLAIGGGGAVGWFPLGYGEVWVPSYRASPAYFHRVNVTNTVVNNVTVTNVYNTTYVNRSTAVTNVRYMNQNVSGAVTAVPQSAMISGRPVSQVAVRVPPSALTEAQVQHAAPVAPQRAAVLGGHTPTSVAPPASVMNRQVVTRTPPPAAPVAFERQQPVLQANPGRPLEPNTQRNLQGAAPQTSRPMYRQVNPGTAPAPVSPGVRPLTPQQNSNPQTPLPNVRPENRGAPQQRTVPTNPATPESRPIQRERREEKQFPPAQPERRVTPVPESPPRAVPPPEIRREQRPEKQAEKQQRREPRPPERRDDKEKKQQL